MRLPFDRKLVDGDGKMLPHWMAVQQRLERFLDFTDVDIRKLRVLLDAQPDPDAE